MEETKEQLNEIKGTPLTDEVTGTSHETRTLNAETLLESEITDSISINEANKSFVTVNEEHKGKQPDNKKEEKTQAEKKKKETLRKNLISLVIAVLAAYFAAQIPRIIVFFRCETRPYITLVTYNADLTQVIKLTKEVPRLQYSLGGKKWKYLGTQPIEFGGIYGKLMLRGDFDGGTDGATIEFRTAAEVMCTGDIRTLVDYKNYDNAFTGAAKFNDLFNDCEQLIIAPDLKIEILASGCYARMFAKTSIKKTPELTAVNLADSCYFSMFEDCKLLEEIPELPALNMADECYMRMFYGCTSLKIEEGKKIPELPASNMAKQCCSSMFEGCKSLKESPKLSATNLAVGCYDKMFAGCISLNHVIMLATEKDPITCMNNWLIGTASKGIFHKNKDATWDNEGIVPSDWEIKDYN